MRQIESETEEDPTAMYLDIENRWLSCLAAPECAQKEFKLWLLDLDIAEEEPHAMCILARKSVGILADYRTPNGRHLIIRPFNTQGDELFLNPILKKDALMLWAWRDKE